MAQLSAAELRKLSAKCRRVAETATDEQLAAALKEMAADFSFMADRIIGRDRA